MNREEEQLLEQLTRYASGESAPHERVAVEALVAESDAAARLLGEVRRAWATVPAIRDNTGDAVVTAHVMQCVQAAILADAEARSTVGPPGARRRAHGARWIWSGTAAVICAVLVAVGVMTRQRTLVPAKIYHTGIGARETIRLSDGTRIVLAPQTTLTVDGSFGVEHRTVRVSGEAYFDVTNATGRPFVVYTGGVTSRVLGTTFLVKYYPGDSEVQVAVQSGRVSVGRHTPVVLSSNSIARISDSTVIVTPDADLHQYSEWVAGKLTVNRIPAAEVFKTLGRWYGLEFHFADSTLAHQEMTGTFTDHEDRSDMLKQLQMILGAQMQFDGNIVTLVPAKMTAVPRPLPGSRRDEQTQQEVGR